MSASVLIPLIVSLLEVLARLAPSLAAIVQGTKDVVVSALSGVPLTDDQIKQIRANTDALRAMNEGIDKDKYGISDDPKQDNAAGS